MSERTIDTLTAYAGHSAFDAALKPAVRQWSGNPSILGDRQVALM